MQILYCEAFNSKTLMSNTRSKHAIQIYRHTGPTMEVVTCLFIIPMSIAHQVMQVLTNVIQALHLLVEVPIMPVWCVEVSNGRIYC